MTHQPDPTNPQFCSRCGCAIEGEEGAACPVEESSCECHDTQAEHEAWFAQELSYWKVYFGDNHAAFDPNIPTPTERAEMLAFKRGGFSR